MDLEGRGASRAVDGFRDALWIGLSDDGEYAAFTRGERELAEELWAVRLAGGEAVRLLPPQDFNEMGGRPDGSVIPMDLHWVPGTHTLGFHANPAVEPEGFFYAPDNLRWVDAETGRAAAKRIDGEIFYSPDGALAAGVNQEHLFLMNADGSGQRIVPIEPHNKIPYRASYQEPPQIHWADDSQSLFVVVPEAAGWAQSTEPDAMVSIWRVEAADGRAVPFARYNADFSVMLFDVKILPGGF